MRVLNREIVDLILFGPASLMVVVVVVFVVCDRLSFRH